MKPTMDAKALLKPQNLRLVLLGLVGVALILAGTFLTGRPKKGTAEDATVAELLEHARTIEAALEEAIGSIRGVGKVRVKVTLASGPETIYAENVSRSMSSQTETLEGGQTRQNISENEVAQPVSGRFGSSETPLIEKTILPQVAGCLIVAEGASSSGVKEDIYRAAQALLGIPLYRIQVAPMKGGS